MVWENHLEKTDFTKNSIWENGMENLKVSPQHQQLLIVGLFVQSPLTGNQSSHLITFVTTCSLTLATLFPRTSISDPKNISLRPTLLPR